MGCASGKNAGPRNIFGNKYGQNLAAVQMAREKRVETKRAKDEEVAAQARLAELQRQGEDDDETDDEEDDDDYGPAPSAGIWAGSQKLQQESERIAENDDDGEEETDDEDDRPNKKVRTDND